MSSPWTAMTNAEINAYMAERVRAYDSDGRSKRRKVPTLAMVRTAYADDLLGYEDLERLTEAALKGESTEIPDPMLTRFFPPTMADVLKEQWTSPRVLFSTTDAPGGVDWYRP